LQIDRGVTKFFTTSCNKPLISTSLLGKPVQDPARKDGSDRSASARACCDEHRSSNARALLRAETTRATVSGQHLPASRHQSRWCCSQSDDWRKNHCKCNESYPTAALAQEVQKINK
jgi:hypothetical protein